jgi:hypothetical protein
MAAGGLMRLFHFTCEHGREAIGRRGELRSRMRHPLLGCDVVWLTSESSPDRESTGLTMRTITCDRMQFRYVVGDAGKCRPWIGSRERDAAPAHHLADLERYGDPEHWWIASEPVKARLG